MIRNFPEYIRVPSGPFLVSRDGKTGRTERSDKVPKLPGQREA